jgi:hypothetical protein
MEQAKDPIVWLGPQGDPIAVQTGDHLVLVSAGHIMGEPDAQALLDEIWPAEFYQLRRAMTARGNDRAAAHLAAVIAEVRRRLPTD